MSYYIYNLYFLKLLHDSILHDEINLHNENVLVYLFKRYFQLKIAIATIILKWKNIQQPSDLIFIISMVQKRLESLIKNSVEKGIEETGGL